MNALKTGFFNKLAGDAALIAELGGDTAIYDKMAPQGRARPYVIFHNTGGGPENINPSDLRNNTFLAKAVADRSQQAGVIDGLIEDALHLQELTVSGYTNFWLAREQEVDYVETLDDGKLVFHEGAYYRIRLDD